jgi:hypothetical protein
LATDASDAWDGVRQDAWANGRRMGVHRDAGAEKLADQALGVRARDESERQVVRWLGAEQDAAEALYTRAAGLSAAQSYDAPAVQARRWPAESQAFAAEHWQAEPVQLELQVHWAPRVASSRAGRPLVAAQALAAV